MFVDDLQNEINSVIDRRLIDKNKTEFLEIFFMFPRERKVIPAELETGIFHGRMNDLIQVRLHFLYH